MQQNGDYANYMAHVLKTTSKCMKIFFFFFLFSIVFGISVPSVLAQKNVTNSAYIPLIGITSVPDPLALPKGAGSVTYNYAVKNFLKEIPLTNVRVVDTKCPSVRFVEGDDNHDGKLDTSETWRYSCTVTLAQTTQSIATATGVANGLTATHKAYTTVVVGSNTLPPLVSIVNITKVAYPYSLPAEGGSITFTYKVNNPGIVPLSQVKVTDDKCKNFSGRLGDRNGNNLLDINEVWIYTCTTTLRKTTTNTAHVTAFANGLEAKSDATIDVKVARDTAQVPNKFPTVGENVEVEKNPYVKVIIWSVLALMLLTFILYFFVSRKTKVKENLKELNPLEGGKHEV